MQDTWTAAITPEAIEECIQLIEQMVEGKGGYRKWRRQSAEELASRGARHVMSWQLDRADPGSGRSHLAHAAVRILQALAKEIEGG